MWYILIIVRSIGSVCESQVDASNGYLATQNFPGRNPAETNCVCSMSSATDITVSVLYLTPSSETSCGDHLTVLTGDTIHAVCEDEHRILQAKELTLMFQAQKTNYRNLGIWIHYNG